MSPSLPRPLSSRSRVAALEAELAATREQLESARAELATAREQAARAATASAGAAGAGEPTASTGVTDAPGAMPRARLAPELVAELRGAGFSPTGGAQPDDPRAYASWVTKLFETRRYTYRIKQEGLTAHPRVAVADKLNNLALAASHGIGVAEVYGLWHEHDEIDLATLPEAFVLKANFSAGSRGVLPLRRVPGQADRYVVADSTGRELTGQEVLAALAPSPRVNGPWYAEELLVTDTGDDPIPPDYKFYCFYGEVGVGFTRRTPQHFGTPGWQHQLRFHDFDGQGSTLAYRHRGATADPTIPLSPLLPEMLEHARTLSRAVPLPFVRVDLYATTRGVQMGEVTLGPGGDQYFHALHDVRLGRMWDRAQLRLEHDLATGERPYAVVAGDHPVPELLRQFLPAAR